MNEAYEVSFQDISKGDLFDLLTEIVSKAKSYSSIEFSEQISENYEAELNKETIEIIFNYQGSLFMALSINEFKIDNNHSISKLFLRVIKYDGQYDLDISFDNVDQINIDSLMCSLHEYSQKLTKRFQIKSIYGGMEPATDEETRYFTNENPGPLALS